MNSLAQRRVLLLLVILALLLALAPAGLAAPAAPLAAISLTGGAYTQNFDTLASSGTSSDVPGGWAFSESGTNANTMYTANDGGSTTGDTYSYGSTGSTERAFGGLQSGSLIPTIGAEFKNDTGATIIALGVSYICEQWRSGVANRNAADRLDFQYSTDATSLTTGTWTDVDALDCLTTDISDPSGAKNGNDSAYRTAVSATVSGLSIPNGAVFWIRWTDWNISSSDDGLAVDDFSITPTTSAADTAPSVTSTTPASGDTGVAVDATVTVTFSEAVTFNSTVAINCTSSGLQNVTPTGGPTIWTLPHSDFHNSETCTVTVEATDVSDADTDDPPDNMAADYTWSFTTVALGGLNLIINEVDADTPGTDALEFVELYDGGVGNSALDGYVVVFYNGNDDKSYAAFDLDTYTTDANGYFVLGNSAVPGVDLVFTNNTLQNGADAVAVYLGNAADFPNGTSVTTANLVDAIVYDTDDADDSGLLVLLNTGQPQVNENGTGKGADYSNQRCPNGSGGARNTDTYKQFPPTPAEANLCPSFIHEVQGSGDTVVPGTFTVEAIVVGDYQGASGVDDWKLDGFFIQEEDRDVDGSAATSEGIFVFCGSCPTNVVVGDKVRVTGASSDYFGMSQLSATTAGAVTVVSSGNPLPTPAAITLPVPGVTGPDLATAQAQLNAYFEPFEGMLVTVGETLSVTEYFELYRYGQLVLSQGGRLRQFTDANAPSASGYTAHLIDKLRRTLILDDDSNQQNHALMEDPDIPVFHPIPGFSITNYVRGGDTIANLTGVLHWSWAGASGTDAWRIRPVMDASNAPVFSYSFTSANPRPAVPAVGGTVKVASFNVLNYFTTLNTGGTPCGPTGGQACRGANSAAELQRQRDKLVAALCAMNADIYGLMELENPNPANDPEPGDGIADYVLKDIVTAMNATGSACPDKTYTFTDGTAAGVDAIRVGIIYKASTVTPVGAPAALTAAAFTDPNSTGSQRNRPALAQSFQDNTWNERFTLVVNHLKSKGSCPSSGPDADQGDGQGCWNDTRAKAAAYLVNTWLPTDPTGSGDPDFLIIGDLNSYRNEDPITAIKSGGYTDLLDTYLGTSAYGYVFDGQLGYLDHALANLILADQVAGVAEWHINADEVNLLDYNDTVQDPAEATYDAKPTATPLYEPNQYRTSDHDPVLIGLNLAAPNQSNLAGYGLAWHTGDGAVRLGSLWSADNSTADNDGVAPTPNFLWSDAGGGSVDVTVTGADGWVTGWIDWNNDGDFADGGEQVFTNLNVPAGTTVTQSFSIPVPVGSQTFNARFRVYPGPQTLLAALQPDAPPSPVGGASGGEVEDYSWSFGPNALGLAAFRAAPIAPWRLVSPFVVMTSVVSLFVVTTLVVARRRARRI